MVISDENTRSGDKSSNWSSGSSFRDFGTNILSRQRERMVESMNGLGSMVRDVSGKLRENNNESLANYVDTLATRVDDFGRAVSDIEFDQVFDNVREFARRRPEIVIGGMFATGLLLGRLLKAATPNITETFRNEGGTRRSSREEGQGRESRTAGSRLSTEGAPAQNEVH